MTDVLTRTRAVLAALLLVASLGPAPAAAEPVEPTRPGATPTPVAVEPRRPGVASTPYAVEPRRPAATTEPSPAPSRPTIVTLGFDDALIEQFATARTVEAYGMRAVYYVNSGRLDSDRRYMSAAQVRQLQDRGHEVGGHSVFHLHLTQQEPAEQTRQICDDRTRLLEQGLRVTNFAYPFGEYDQETQRIVRSCGYQSARRTSGIMCAACPAAETVPPGDRYAMRAVSDITPDTTAAHLTTVVQAAGRQRGWLQIVFHHVCATTPCATNAVRQGELTTFLRWLAGQQRTGAVVVSTVRQVLGGSVLPVPARGAAAPPDSRVRNGSFEEPPRQPGAPPRCFQYTSSGSGNAYAWSLVTDAHTGARAVRAQVPAVGGAVTLLTTQDLGSCAPTVHGGRSYQVNVWYRATSPVRLVAYAREPRGNYGAFAASAPFPARREWTLASWITRAVPGTGEVALGLGFSVSAPGTYLVDDLTLAPSARTTAAHMVAHEVAQEPFVPSDDEPPIPVAGQSRTVPVSGDYRMSLALDIGVMLLVAFALVIWLDRRFRRIHRATQAP